MRRLTLALALCLAAAPALAQAPVSPRSTVPGAHGAPDDRARVEFLRAQQALRTGAFHAARLAAERAADFDPLSSEVQMLLGACLLGDNEPRRAYQAYARAGLLDPTSANAYNRAGQVLLQYLGRPAGAKAAFEQALRIDPRHAPAHLSQHFYHLLRGELPEALAEIDAASKNVSSDDEHFLYLGFRQVLSLYRGNYESSIGGIESHLELVAGDGRTMQARALAHRLLGWYADAERGLRELVRAARQPDPGLIVDLGLTLRAQGERDSARTYFLAAQELDPDRLEATYNLALEAVAAGDTSAALAYLGECYERDPDGYPALLLAGRLLAARGESERAGRAYAAAHRAAPISEAAALAVGEKPLLADNWSADTLFRAIEGALLTGDVGVAGHKGLEACGQPASRPLGLALASLAKEMTPGSAGQRVVHLEAAREAAPDAGEAWLAYLETRLARAHAEIGNVEDAEELYRSVLARKNLSVDARLPALNAYLAWRLQQGRVDGELPNWKPFEGVTDPRYWRVRAEWATATGDITSIETFRERERAAQFLP